MVQRGRCDVGNRWGCMSVRSRSHSLPRSPGRRERAPSAAARRPATAGGPGSTDRFRARTPRLLRPSLSLARPRGAASGDPRDPDPLAPQGLAPLLDLEEPTEQAPPGWTTTDPRRSARADPRHGPPQLAGPALGYQADPGRAREAQNLRIQEVGAEDPPGDQAAQAGRAALVHLPPQPLGVHLGLSTSSRCRRSSSASSTSSSS